MKPYIYSILCLLSVTISFAQTEEVILKKSFKVDENTILNLDLDNVAIVFEESFDDKIHFDYVMFFGRFSKRKREMIIKKSKIKTSKNGDFINLKVINSEFLGINLKYYPDYDSNSRLIALQDFINSEKKRVYNYKSKDSLLKEIKESQGSNMDDFFKKRYKKFEKNRMLKNKKVIVKIFSIKVPKYVKIRLKAIQTDVSFTYDITKPIVVNSFKGFLKFKNILCDDNSISSNNGILQAYSINNSNIYFRDMNKVVIGSAFNSEIKTETSKIQIGEIKENVSIIDFNSKLYFYNFHENFNKFNLKGDYTELNLYKVKDTNFSMDVSGFNTILNMQGVKTSFGASTERELTKILQKKRKENSPFLGNVEVILKNGILNIK
ncbi:MAG: hypothetical protein AB8B78_07450 [Polaribacter sp.]